MSLELAKFVDNKNDDVIQGLEAAQDVLKRLWKGESPNDLEKEKGLISRCGDGTIGCGLSKVRVFQQCVVPPMKEYFSGTGRDLSS